MKLKSCALEMCLSALVRGAEIAGQIVDPSGAAVAGVVVGLECTGAARREAVTDPEGRYRFAAAADARCRMRVDAPGFKPVAAAVRAGTPSRHVLELAAQSAEVTVAASVVDNMDAVALERSLIADLPVAGNEVLAALADFLDSPALGSAGSSVIVDGLESPAGRIPAALIQEVRINDNPYSAEYSRPGRGRIEIVSARASPSFTDLSNSTFATLLWTRAMPSPPASLPSSAANGTAVCRDRFARDPRPRSSPASSARRPTSRHWCWPERPTAK